MNFQQNENQAYFLQCFTTFSSALPVTFSSNKSKQQDKISSKYFDNFLSYHTFFSNRNFSSYFQLSGGLQIFFGATFAWNHLNYSLVLGNHFWIPSTVLLCLGPVTYVLCWLGWNAVSKRNRNYLKIVRNPWRYSEITSIFYLFSSRHFW